MILFTRIACLMLALVAIVAFFAMLGQLIDEPREPFPLVGFITLCVAGYGCIGALWWNLHLSFRKGKDG